jgi:hypothetical protein
MPRDGGFFLPPSLPDGPTWPSRSGSFDSPLFLNPLGAKTLRTPRMKERESKSQRATRTGLRIALDVLAATDKVRFLPSPPARRVRQEQRVPHACVRA